MSSPVHLLHPSFTFKIKHKVDKNRVALDDPYTLTLTEDVYSTPAISTDGFPGREDGTYAFAAAIEVPASARYYIGFTDVDVASTHTLRESFPGYDGMSGVSFDGLGGHVYLDRQRQDQEYFDYNFTRAATEVVAILRISEGGSKKSVQWIVDGQEGAVLDCSSCFTYNKNTDDDDDAAPNLIYPCICLGNVGQRIRSISLVDDRELIKSDGFKNQFANERHSVKAKFSRFFEKHAPYNLPRLNTIISELMWSKTLMKNYCTEQMKELFGEEII